MKQYSATCVRIQDTGTLRLCPWPALVPGSGLQMSGIFTIREQSIWAARASVSRHDDWFLLNCEIIQPQSVPVLISSWPHLINQSTINQHEPSDLSLHPPPGLCYPHLCWGRLHGLSIRPKIVLWKCDCKWEWVTQMSWGKYLICLLQICCLWISPWLPMGPPSLLEDLSLVWPSTSWPRR